MQFNTQSHGGSSSKSIGPIPISYYRDLANSCPDENAPRPGLVVILQNIPVTAVQDFVRLHKPLSVVGPYWVDNPARTSEAAVQIKAALGEPSSTNVGSVVVGSDLGTRVEYLAWATTAGLTPMVLLPDENYPWQWLLNQFNQHAVLTPYQHYHLAGKVDFDPSIFPGYYSWGCELRP